MRIRRLLLEVFPWVGMCRLLATTSSAMDITIEEMQLGPFGESVWIRMEGEIVSGDSDKLLGVIQGLDFNPGQAIYFEFDSPGGNFYEGMRIGILIDGLPHGVTTNVGGRGLGEAGVCASACVLAFLGGHYRFADEGEIGVHQFFSDVEMTSREATSRSQSASAEIVNYLVDMRVDPAFFEAMTCTHAENVYWVPEGDLARYRVASTGRPGWKLSRA